MIIIYPGIDNIQKSKLSQRANVLTPWLQNLNGTKKLSVG